MAPSTTLPTRQLGKNGPQVTALGLGLMGLSAFYGPTKPQAERLAFLDAAYAAGELHWDSADVYMDSEDLLGEWFKLNPEKRKDIFLATKFGNKGLPGGQRVVDSTPEYVREACEKSLKRLGLPSVDLYYVHRLDKKTPVEKTIEAMAQLKNEGKIKYLGMSECSAESLRRAHKVHPISVIQMEYSLMTLDIETPQIDLLRTARELGVAVVAYSPIGRGFITGQFKSPNDFPENDFRRLSPRYSEQNFAKNFILVDKVLAIAKKKGVPPAQLALKWLMDQGDDIIPIPGTTNIQRLHENLGAYKVQLTPQEDKEIREASENAEISGARYPEAMVANLYADTPPLSSA